MVFGFLGGSVCVGSVGGMAPRVYTQRGVDGFLTGFCVYTRGGICP